MATLKVVGKSILRVDGLEKVTGKATFTGDISLPHMLYGKVLRSPYPHARIISIDVSQAEKLAGVKTVVTGKDSPQNKFGYIQDRSVITPDIVRFVGEPVAAVAATSPEVAEEALDLIEVDYEELPAIFDVEEALGANPPVVVHPDLPNYHSIPRPTLRIRIDPALPNVGHHHLVRKGNTEKGFNEADLVIENKFIVPRMHHCQMEPHIAIARPESDGGLTIWASGHTFIRDRMDICQLFGMSQSKVRVISPYIGGSFGGKSMMGWPGPIAIMLASKAGRPVKLAYGREEAFVDGSTEVPMIIYIKDGVKSDGTLLAREMKALLNLGAYGSRGVGIVRNCSFSAAGVYRIPNFKWDSYGVYTNEPPVGAFRGFSGTQITWAIERQMDMIAVRLGIDPLEIRRQNILEEGEKDVTGMAAYNIGIRECIEKMEGWIGWSDRQPKEDGLWRRGKGFAIGTKYTSGMPSVVLVKVHEDATIEIRHSAHEVGQGCNTVLAQMAAEEFGTSVDKIRLVFTDSAVTPYDSGAISSRTTFMTGNALRLACKDAKRQLFEIASPRLGVPPDDLEITDGKVYTRDREDLTVNVTDLFMSGIYMAGLGEIIGRGQFNIPLAPENPDTGQSARPVVYYAYGACAVEVAVNVKTGEVRVLKLGQCWDAGQPINEKLCEGQIEGGTGMGIGRALYEQMVVENGVTVNPNFVDYKLPSLLEMPAEQMKSVMASPRPHKEGPFGAKGFSEGGLLTVAPAIGNAVYNAVGAEIKDLPIAREKLLRELETAF